MTHYEMCKAALLRPDDYSQLSKHRQWDIDKGLGILDWEGVHLSRASEFLESRARWGSPGSYTARRMGGCGPKMPARASSSHGRSETAVAAPSCRPTSNGAALVGLWRVLHELEPA